MLWPRADTGRGAQEQRFQPWCPGSASLPFLQAAKPFLLRGPADPSSSSGLSAYRAATPRLQINLWLQLEQGEGLSLEERRWEKEGEQQSSSFLPQPPAPGASGRAGLGKGTQEHSWDTPAANTKLLLRSQPGYFPKPIITSVLDR